MPDPFVVIGAQKCGTTTLYEDLRTHPDVGLAPKESAWLLEPGLERAAYLARFPDRLVVGEVATDYAMLPALDAATPARECLDDLRVVYVVRDPVRRTLSHHHHLLAEGRVGTSFDDALAAEPSLVDNSRYATQLEPWLAAYGAERVLVLRFEDYTGDRQAGFDRLTDFLGLSPRPLPDPDVAHNTSADKRVAVGGWRRLRGTGAYRVVRRLLPDDVRRRLLRRVLPPPPPPPPAPTEETLQWLVDTLSPEVDRLAGILGTAPWWDLDVHRAVAP